MGEQRANPIPGVFEGLTRFFSSAGAKNARSGGARAERAGLLSWLPWNPGPVSWTVIGIAALAAVIFAALSIFIGRDALVKERPAAETWPLESSSEVRDRPTGADVAETPAAVEPEAPRVVVRPERPRASVTQDEPTDWIIAPSRRQISQYYPTRALEHGIEGAVTLRCTFRERRYPDCAVRSETPEGWRFGAQARRLSRRFRPTEQAIRGRPFSVTVKFELR